MESQAFDKIREDYLNDEEFQQFQIFLMTNPEAGDRIKGSGGIRKVRWAVKGECKRGAIRVIYYYIVPQSKIFLITMYRKSDVSDLTPKEINQLKELLKNI